MNIRYEMDELAIDWKIGEGSFEFTPSDIEFTVTKRPDVTIKYLGGPIYVPPSAGPNYESVDVKVLKNSPPRSGRRIPEIKRNHASENQVFR